MSDQSSNGTTVATVSLRRNSRNLMLLVLTTVPLTLIALKRKDVKAPGAPEEPMLDMVMRTVREFVPSGKAA